MHRRAVMKGYVHETCNRGLHSNVDYAEIGAGQYHAFLIFTPLTVPARIAWSRQLLEYPPLIFVTSKELMRVHPDGEAAETEAIRSKLRGDHWQVGEHGSRRPMR